MALVLNDRVRETSTTVGTGAIALGGAVTDYISFSSGIGANNTTYYCISNPGLSEWEVGLGTLDVTATNLSRTVVLTSSNGNALVTFSSGVKDVFCDIPASKLIYTDASGNSYVPNLGATTASTGKFTSVTTPSVTATTGDLNLTPIGSGQLYLNQSQTGAFGTVIARDVGASNQSARLFFDSSAGVSSIRNNGGNLLTFATAATISSASGTTQFVTAHTASAVNYVQVTGAATGSRPSITAQGSDTNAGLSISAKGAGNILFFQSGSVSAGTNQTFQISTGGTANYFNVSPSNAGSAPILGLLGSDTNVSMALQTKGTGAIDLAAGSSGVNISNGGTITAVTTATRGSGYTAMPSVALSAPTTSGGVQATATALLNVNTITLVSGGTGYSVNDVLTVSGVTGGTVQVTVNTVSAGVISTFTITNFGSGTISAIPANPVSVTGGTGSGATFTVNWNCGNITVGTAGSGYVEQPTVTITGGSVNGTAFASVGGATIVRSLASPLSLYTQNGEGFRVQNSGTASTSFWTAFGTSTTPILRAVSSVSGAIGTESAVPIQFQTNTNFEQFRVSHTASAVNYMQITGNTTGQSPVLASQGSDATVGMSYIAKGAGYHFFYSSNAPQFSIVPLTSAVNYLAAKGGIATNAPTLSALGTDTNISMAFQSKGTGAIDLAAGSSGVNISNGGTVTAVTITNNGATAYTSHPTPAITAPTTAGGVQAVATSNLYYNSALATTTIVSGGTGYTLNDVLTISGGTFTASATFTVTGVTGGVVNAITPTAGGTYSAIPTGTLSVTGGTGTGFTLTINGWGVRSLNITNAGSGYIEQPTVTFSGGGGSGASAYASVGGNTVLRSLGTSIDIYTPSGPAFRVADNPGIVSARYVQAFGASASGNPALLASAGNLVLSSGTSGAIQFYSSSYGVEQMRVSHTASAVNYVNVTGAATNGQPTISAAGSDTNIPLQFNTKGNQAFNFYTNGGTQRQFRIVHTGSSVNFGYVAGSATGTAVTFGVDALSTDTNIDLALTPKGTGVVQFGTYTGTISAITGYITIKDAGGTVRKLAVVA